MTDGYRVGGAYIDVDADADAAVAKLRRQLKSAKGPLSLIADEIGDEFGRRLGNKIEKNLRATKGRIGSIATGIGNDAGSKIVSNMDKQLKGAKGRLGRSASEIGSTIGAKVSTALSKDLGGKFDASLGAKARQVGEGIGSALGDGVDDGAAKTVKSSPKTKSALDSVASRSQAQFKGLVFAGAFAGLPVAAGAAAAATIAVLGGIPLALVAGAAAIQKGNAEVARSYTQLGSTATAVMQRASSVLTKDLVAGTDKLTKGMLKLEPAMTGAFRLAAPAVDGLVTAVTTFADEALPGTITALTKTNDAMRGLTTLSQGAGRGVTDFFQNLSTGSASAATNAGVLGRIIQDLLGAAGQLLANLNNGGTSALGAFANAMSQVYAVVLNLTSNGMGPLSAGVTGFITVVSGALGLVQGMTSALGGWLSPLLAIAGAFKAVDMLTFGRLTSNLSAEFTGLGGSIRSAEGAGGKFRTMMGGLVSAAISPAGLATAGLVVGLGLLGMAQQRAAQAAAEHKARVGDLASALRESNGAIDGNVRSLAAKALADIKVSTSSKSVLESARELGISLPLLTSAYLGNADAQKKVNEELGKRGAVAADKVLAGEKATEQERAEALAAFNLQQELKGTNTEYGKAVQKNRDLAAATAGTNAALEKTSPAAEAAAAASNKLRAAWTTMYSPLASVADRANALISILDRLSGRTPSFEEAIQSNNDTLRTMASALTDAGFAANGFGDALLNSDGTVSTWTKNGSDLQNNLVQLQSGFANAGASIHELVAGGMTYEAAAQQVNATLTTQRNEFVALAQKMGLSADKANDLATKYGLLPAEVVTKVTDYGSAVNTSADVDTLTGKLKAMPPDTPVRITSITAEAEKKLVDMNYTVTHMSDGTVLVFANTASAEQGIGRVQGGVNALQSKTITITVNEIRNAIEYSKSVGSVGGQATGGYQFPASRFGGPRKRATGGSTPFFPGLEGATWTGERGPELSFPSQTAYIATNQQSMAFERRAKSGEAALEKTVNITSPNPAVAPNITININVTPPPSMDLDALTAKITRKVERALKGGS